MNKSNLSLSEFEECFIFEVYMVTGIDINELDSFLKNGDLPEDIRSNLVSERGDAFKAYIAGNFELAVKGIEAAYRGAKFQDLYSQSAPYARAGIKHRKTQKNRAKASRTDPAISGMIERLSKIDEPYKELWGRFLEMLDNAHMDPSESVSGNGLAVEYIKSDGASRSMAFTTFRNNVGKCKKSR